MPDVVSLAVRDAKSFRERGPVGRRQVRRRLRASLSGRRVMDMALRESPRRNGSDRISSGNNDALPGTVPTFRTHAEYTGRQAFLHHVLMNSNENLVSSLEIDSSFSPNRDFKVTFAGDKIRT